MVSGFFLAVNNLQRLTKTRTKKSRPVGRLFLQRADYFAGAEAAASEAAEAAVEAALAAVEAAAAASEAAEAAVEAAAAASGAGAAGAGAGAASTTGAGAGASSFLLQAAKATANRETISRDFFMGFSLINSKVNQRCCDE